MIQIAGVGEEIIMAAMKEYDTAQGEDKLIYAERMRAKIEAVMDMSRTPDAINFDELRRNLGPAITLTGLMPDKPEPAKDPEPHPMAPKDINNVDVVVKKKGSHAKKTDRQKELEQVEKMMKAGKTAKEIADETGRDGKDILEDMNWIRGQSAK